jgi:phosphatidylglycerophosphate synthase
MEIGVDSEPLARARPRSDETFKARDVEEPIDYWVNRRLANVLVSVFAPTSITPNQVTILSGVVGLVAGILIGTSPLTHPLQVSLGGMLLYLSILLDCADGQLARLRRQSSMVGRMLDGVIDLIPTASVFTGFLVFLYRGGHGFLFLNALGWTSGYAMKWHVHAYDHAKNIYLRNVLPPSEQGNALPTLEEIERERQRLLDEGDRLGALILRGFAQFTQSQRTGWQEDRMGLRVRGTETPAERATYREAFAGSMKLWIWNGLGSHLVLLLVASVATLFYPDAALVVWWFILIPMSLFAVYLLRRDRRIEHELQRRLGRA